MGADSRESQPSTLLVDECFSRQDDRFIDLVREVRNSKYLAGLADRWKQDPRPWARDQIFQYLEKQLNCPGHHPLVKRLFKHAETKADDELMAAFLVAFDRLIRRQRRMSYKWDFQTRQSWREEVLFSPRDQILVKRAAREARNPFTGDRFNVTGYERIPKNGRLFSYATRSYLRRRVWRYFRWMGFGRPGDYPSAIARALMMYRDEDFDRGEHILDNWSLMNITFRGSNQLEFTPARINIADGGSLSQLTAAPRFEDLWKKPESAAELLKLVMQANSRLIRVWAITLLKRHHASNLQQIPVEQLLQMLDHNDEDVQQLGASLISSLTGIDSWPVSTWLRLLETRNITALATICDAMNQRVRPDRLNLDQCVALACARVTPVARLGLSWLRNRTISSDQDRAKLANLAAARCEAVAAEIAEFALSILGTPQVYKTDTVVSFFDSLNPEIRRGAWEWLTPQSPGYTDPDLWTRLFETPYDDVRLRLVDELRKRTQGVTNLPTIRNQDFAPLWTSVLLGVHRGGRAKRHALRQISQTIAEQPEQAEHLMPVLVVAIRSVRPAEARVGLSAILSAVAIRPELEAILQRSIPELRLVTAEGTS
jgi:hypothetical protein